MFLYIKSFINARKLFININSGNGEGVPKITNQIHPDIIT